MELFISGVRYVKDVLGGILVETAEETEEFMTSNNNSLIMDDGSKFIVVGE